MTEQPDIASETQGDGQQPTDSEPQATGWVPPGGAGHRYATSSAAAAQRPELMVGAAFAGGLLAALILKRLAR